MEDCVFCKIVRGEIPCKKVYEGDNFIVIDDANPVSEGHCLIIPKKHYRNIFDLPMTLGSELVGIAKEQGLRLINSGKADGIKLVNNNEKASGQVVFHYHMHVIPEKLDFSREKSV